MAHFDISLVNDESLAPALIVARALDGGEVHLPIELCISHSLENIIDLEDAHCLGFEFTDQEIEQMRIWEKTLHSRRAQPWEESDSEPWEERDSEPQPVKRTLHYEYNALRGKEFISEFCIQHGTRTYGLLSGTEFYKTFEVENVTNPGAALRFTC